jgi:TetR/AcrR family transcriptional regulator, mexJK operon transcriptional repressor
MPRRATKAAARGGRPSRAEALRLRERILAAARELFLAEGYGLTSIEAVAKRAAVSKRTFYDRFDDKAALFAAVVHGIMEDIRPPPEVPLIEGATLEQILFRIAMFILRAGLKPQAVALHRLVNAEAARFPELVRAVAGDGIMVEATDLIGGLLDREFGASRLARENREFAATQFIFMVLSVPQRRAMGYGEPMSESELEGWAAKVVDLFLGGCRNLSA